MEELITAPRSPFQNPDAERVIGSIHRFVTSTPFRSASQDCQRAYQSRWRAAFRLSTRHFSVISAKGSDVLQSSQRENRLVGLDMWRHLSDHWFVRLGPWVNLRSAL